MSEESSEFDAQWNRSVVEKQNERVERFNETPKQKEKFKELQEELITDGTVGGDL